MTLATLNNFDTLTDIFFRDFFNRENPFVHIEKCSKQDVPYPVNIKKYENHISFEISALGLEKKDIDIKIEDDIISVSYDKNLNVYKEDPHEILHEGITRKSFKLGWKISPKYDISDVYAYMNNGLLIIDIQKSKKHTGRTVQIK